MAVTRTYETHDATGSSAERRFNALGGVLEAGFEFRHGALPLAERPAGASRMAGPPDG